ncbi:MAG TPA: hypothetical protein VFV20_10985 [Candidatus Limnocylindria bacterium]|nr:hypothetical protein [Candidatus Limnocylindria bacterium]
MPASASLWAWARGHSRAIGFVMRLLPMLPSGPIDRVTRAPVIENVRYPSLSGEREGVVYRPPGPGPHPAIVLCLGVVPFGVDHPQVPRLETALARFGFLALIHWSPAMRDLRLVPDDAEDIALAYEWLLSRADVDASRSGLFGTCVGGSFALLAAARPRIRDRVAFVGAFAPFSSVSTLVRDIASGTTDDGVATSWAVDQLTRQVFVRSVTCMLEPAESDALRTAYEQGRPLDPPTLSVDARAVHALLFAGDRDAADDAMRGLPASLRERLDRMSPLEHVAELAAPLVMFGHDRDDHVIPVGESRRLAAALAGRPGVRYTEYAMFEHADPTKRKLSPLRLVVEVRKFYLSLYPMFRQAVG